MLWDWSHCQSARQMYYDCVSSTVLCIVVRLCVSSSLSSCLVSAGDGEHPLYDGGGVRQLQRPPAAAPHQSHRAGQSHWGRALSPGNVILTDEGGQASVPELSLHSQTDQPPDTICKPTSYYLICIIYGFVLVVSLYIIALYELYIKARSNIQSYIL